MKTTWFSLLAAGALYFTAYADTQTFNIAIGDTVSDGVPAAGAGNIEQPGAEDIYLFDATAGQKVYLQRLAGNWPLDCDLYDPDGGWLGWQKLGFDLGRFDLTKTGTYRIVVSAWDGWSTGTYGFKLWGVTYGVYELAIGDTVSDGVPAAGAGNIEQPGTVDIYFFQASGGGAVYLQRLAGNGPLYWVLEGPGGVYSGRWLDYDLGPLWLSPGLCELVVWGEEGGTGTYSFKLWSVTDGVDEYPIGYTRRLGDLMNQLGDPIVVGPLMFSDFEYETASGPSPWDILVTPFSFGGNYYGLRFEGPFRAVGPAESGLVVDLYITYSVTAEPNLGMNGIYHALGARTTHRGAVFSTLRILPSEIDMVGYSRLTFLPFYGTTDIVDPPGEWSEIVSDILTWAPPQNRVLGDLDLLQFAQAGETASIGYWDTGYSVVAAEPPEIQTFAINYGDTVSDGQINGTAAPGAGNIEQAGSVDEYTFSGTADQRIYLDWLTSSISGELDWELLQPNGQRLVWGWIPYDSGTVTLPENGTYTLRVFPANFSTGTYSFKLWGWTVPAPQSFAINYGDTVSDGQINGTAAPGAGNIEQAGSVDEYTFSGTADQRIYLDWLTSSISGELDWELLQPNGQRLVWGGWIPYDSGTVTLPENGTYTLRVFPANFSTGTYSFMLWGWTVPAPQSFAINYGDTVSDGQINGTAAPGAGNIEQAGSVDEYTFSGTADQRIYLDWLTSSIGGNSIGNCSSPTDNALCGGGGFRTTAGPSRCPRTGPTPFASFPPTSPPVRTASSCGAGRCRLRRASRSTTATR
ncbi:MAG: hypothetical protein IPM17_14350 [Verrucomicrobia bacterium]|nr:hypothetical protein [Verrucomicrobiota bacterium]